MIEITGTFSAYSGELPPDSWINPIEDDLYETNGTAVDTSLITLDETQAHTLSSGDDIDVMMLQLEQDSAYTATVNANMDNELRLYDSSGVYINGAEEMTSTVSSSATQMSWTAPYEGAYYLRVTGDAGYYEIGVVQSVASDTLVKSLSKATKSSIFDTQRKTFETFFSDKGINAIRSLMESGR